LKKLDHHWIDFEDFFEKHGANIPPGTALRKYQERYERTKSKTNPKPPLPQDRAIDSGRRQLLNIALRSALSGGMIIERETPAGGREIRANVFSAEYIDAILAGKPHAEVAKKEEVVDVPVVETPVVSNLPQLMFDHKNVKRDVEVQHNKPAGIVIVIIKDVVDDHDLVINFSAPASDWLSDQLGMQAMFIRGGRENPEKIFRT
jgi:hypothetical protein